MLNLACQGHGVSNFLFHVLYCIGLIVEVQLDDGRKHIMSSANVSKNVRKLWREREEEEGERERKKRERESILKILSHFLVAAVQVWGWQQCP